VVTEEVENDSSHAYRILLRLFLDPSKKKLARIFH